MNSDRLPAIVVPHEGRLGPTRGIDGDIATLQRVASACRMAMHAHHVDETTDVMGDELVVRTHDCEGPTLYVASTIASTRTRIFEFSIPETDRRRRRDAVVLELLGRTPPEGPLSLLTERSLPVAAALMEAAAAMLAGEAPIGERGLMAASHALSMEILRTHPDGPLANGRTSFGGIAFDHQPETPLEPASLSWNRHDVHVRLPPPAFPAAMTLRRGRGFMTLAPIFGPTLMSDAPPAMDALRAVSLVRTLTGDPR